MQAIEFIAEPKNDMIKIPKKYVGNLTKKVRIIILVDEKEATPKTAKSKKKFSAFKVDTKGLTINRDEANVRSSLL